MAPKPASNRISPLNPTSRRDLAAEPPRIMFHAAVATCPPARRSRKRSVPAEAAISLRKDVQRWCSPRSLLFASRSCRGTSGFRASRPKHPSQIKSLRRHPARRLIQSKRRGRRGRHSKRSARSTGLVTNNQSWPKCKRAGATELCCLWSGSRRSPASSFANL